MSWIKARSILPLDPAVAAISRRFGWARHDAAVGPLLMVWAWASELTLDGRVDGAALLDVDAAASQPGFGAALVDVGWLIVEGSALVFPKWDRHNSQTAKGRSLASQRQSRWRSNVDGRSSQACNDRSSPEERRGEKKRRKDSPPPPSGGAKSPLDVPMPAALTDPAFEADFKRFCQHRAQGWPREKWTVIAAERKLSELSKLGLPEAQRWMTFALDRGLKNIQEPFINGFHKGQAIGPEKTVEQHQRDIGLL